MTNTSDERKNIIQTYVDAYNSFDIERMLELLHTDIEFRNYANNEVTVETKGIEQFRQTAEQATQLFSQRQQTITNYSIIEDDKMEVEIDYVATLASDLPNGLKAGEKLELKGKSVFQLLDNKIIILEDYS
jgi:ketosteroid isomerase-like protein